MAMANKLSGTFRQNHRQQNFSSELVDASNYMLCNHFLGVDAVSSKRYPSLSGGIIELGKMDLPISFRSH